jgi:hypothetical protein
VRRLRQPAEYVVVVPFAAAVIGIVVHDHHDPGTHEPGSREHVDDECAALA